MLKFRGSNPQSRRKRRVTMEYEMVREIKNLCPNNQMRDIFFDEVETEDPEGYDMHPKS